jgi:hypothetical protein
MNLVMFLMTLAISFVVVRVGAIALQLTGLEWSLAKFQALSCFSGTGFTTRESELIVGHPKRRKIAATLMILGNAGFVLLIATSANSLRPLAETVPAGMGPSWGTLIPLVNLLVIAGAAFLIYRFYTRSRTWSRLSAFLSRKVKASGLVEPVSFEELMVATGGYGVVRVTLCEGSPLVGKSLAQSGLRQNDVTVLVVRRDTQSTANPPADAVLARGDDLLCFGQLDHMRQEFGCAGKRPLANDQ